MNPQKLLVSHHRAGRTHAVSGGAVSELGDAVPAEHAGAPALPPRGRGSSAPAQRRAVAVDPGGTRFPVTRGGDGQPHATEGDEPDTVAVPGPLAEGGHLHRRGGDTDTSGSEG
jgi:hypothetical protein